jgi:SNF2 family DNA or RNA helicase
MRFLEFTGRLLVEVNFGTNEVCLRKYEQLEPIEENESLKDLIAQGKYGTLSDLRRIVTYEKIKGQLTNIIYSMESSNTDFYPHQFKPVLKLLDSPVGRLLIADEVGLGKTIEAILIWKELQAREDARRLIVLCPAVLREKWKFDLLTKFNIDSEIINAQRLLDQVKKCKPTSAFVYIVSIEGVRPRKNWQDTEQGDNRSLLARFLDEHQSTEEFSIFDLAIIDEAHYLRNAETANNQLGELIRDSSKHLLLLTATPIQTKHENLLNLLRLVSPEDFK